MTIQEAKQAMDEMKAQNNYDDEDLLGILYLMFQNDELTFDELEALVDALGYEITEEFRNMSPEDQKTKGFKETGTEDGAAEDVSQGEVEEAKEMESDEAKDSEESDGQEKTSEESDGQEKEPENKNDDEEELKQARKLYGFDK